MLLVRVIVDWTNHGLLLGWLCNLRSSSHPLKTIWDHVKKRGKSQLYNMFLAGKFQQNEWADWGVNLPVPLYLDERFPRPDEGVSASYEIGGGPIGLTQMCIAAVRA